MSGHGVTKAILGLGRAGWIGLFVVGFLLTCASAATAYWSDPRGPRVEQLRDRRRPARSRRRRRRPRPRTGSNAITVGWSLPGEPGVRRRLPGHAHGGPGSARSCARSASRPHDVLPGRRASPPARPTRTRSWPSSGTTGSRPPCPRPPRLWGSPPRPCRVAASGRPTRPRWSAVGGSGSYTWALSSGTAPGRDHAQHAARARSRGPPTALDTTVRAGLHRHRWPGPHGHVRIPHA